MLMGHVSVNVIVMFLQLEARKNKMTEWTAKIDKHLSSEVAAIKKLAEDYEGILITKAMIYLASLNISIIMIHQIPRRSMTTSSKPLPVTFRRHLPRFPTTLRQKSICLKVR
jgi:hypothetical protein